MCLAIENRLKENLARLLHRADVDKGVKSQWTDCRLYCWFLRSA